MRHGHNYLHYLEGELARVREDSENLRETSVAAEAGFRKLLPPDEDPLAVSNESLSNPQVVAVREAFREAHTLHCFALARQAEVEDELFIFPEDFH